MKSPKQHVPNGMVGLAQRYADELSAQFRTLNLFVQHAGEIGRAHETFLRGVLERFLPSKLRCGTGFVASKDGVTTQQDIIIFDHVELPVLLEVGDCLVVDRDAAVGTVEVKTSLDSRGRFTEALQKLGEQRRDRLVQGFVGLYAWDGISAADALGCMWDQYRSFGPLDVAHLPDAVYVRGKYLIMPKYDGRLDFAPLLIMQLKDGDLEGAALLSFVTRMWATGIQSSARWPWWTLAWRNREAEFFNAVPWPEDLKALVAEHLQRAGG
jgi:hypothetical protein